MIPGRLITNFHVRPGGPDFPHGTYPCERCQKMVFTVDLDWLYLGKPEPPTNWYCEPCFRLVVSGKAAEPTEYAFTLTCSPKDGVTVADMVAAAEYISKYGLTHKPEERPTKFAYVVEHPDSNFHIHGVYSTVSGRRISPKYFKRAWPLWDEKVKLGNGHRGGYHAKCVDSTQYQGYLEKEGVVILR